MIFNIITHNISKFLCLVSDKTHPYAKSPWFLVLFHCSPCVRAMVPIDGSVICEVCSAALS